MAGPGRTPTTRARTGSSRWSTASSLVSTSAEMRHRQAIALLALIGWFIAFYLWLYKIGAIGALTCGTGACEYVQTSRWAVWLGVPVAFYGVVGYAALFGVALVGV